MGDEKIKQNIDRTYGYLYDWLFSTLGFDKNNPEDVIKVLNGVAKKIKNNKNDKFNPTEISLCPNCNCATHTLSSGKCGKCKKIK